MSTREFDSIIKQKTQHRKAAVPPDIWEGIVNARKKDRKPFGWLVLLALLIGTGIAYWIMDTSHDKYEVSSNKKINHKEKVIVYNNASTKNNSPVTSGIQDGSIAIVKEKNSNVNSLTVINPPTTKLGFSQTGNITSENNDGYFKRKQKRNIKGKSKLTIINGETDEAVVTADIHSASDVDKLLLNTSSNKTAPTIESTVQTNIAAKPNDEKQVNDSMAKVDTASAVKAIEPDVKNLAAIEMPKLKKDSKKQQFGKLAIEVGASLAFPVQEYREPLYIQRMLVTSNSNAAFKSTKKIVANIETGGGFSINLVKKINRKWSVGTGLGYLRFTESLEMHGTETATQFTIVHRLKEGPFGPYLQPDTVSTTTTYNTTLTGRNIYSNISLPVFVRYRFNENRKISLELTTGFTVSVMRKYSNHMPGQFTTVYENGISKASEKNSIGFDAFAGLFVKGKLNRHYGWFASSSFAYNFTSYNGNNLSFNKRIHMPSITAGFIRELRK